MARSRLAVALAVSAVAACGGVLDTFVNSGRIAGAVTAVLDSNGSGSIQAIGYRELERKRPMHRDTIFQIMSMTKPVTAVAVMILAEERRLRLDDPVRNYVPEFGSRSDGGREITIRQLLTHTSGLPGEDPKEIWDERVKRSHTLAEVAKLVAEEAAAAAPGTRSLYSGPGFAVLGRVVEVAGGLPFETFLQQRIFDPLRMRNTFFFPPVRVRDRIASVYQFQDGRLTRADVDLYREGAKYANPAGGLFSTAHDIMRFLRMMLNGGALGGKRIVSARAVAEMTAPQPVAQPADECAPRFGLGWQVSGANATCGTLRRGSYGHPGAFGTYMWVDTVRRLAGVFLIQRIGGGNDERDAFVLSVE